jgi:fibronectin-binding autotransporter adhesin
MSDKINGQGGRINRGIRGQMIWLAAAAAVSLGGIGSAFAVVPSPPVTWDATGTADYNIGTNWNPDLAGPPLNSDNQFLTINNGATAEINGIAEGAFLILGLSTGQSGNLVINPGITGNTSTFGEIRVGGREFVPDDYTTWATSSANNGGNGTVIQNPGTIVNVTYRAVDNTEPPVQSFYVGDSSGGAATGSYTITGTAALPSTLLSGIAKDDAIVAGTGPGTVATFTQNDFTTVTSTGFVIVGRKGATGTYNLNGGTLNAQAGTVTATNTALFVGDGDTTGIQSTSGTFNQSGGTFNASGVAIVGRRGGDGFYNLSSGNLIVTGSTTGLVLGDGNDATTYPSTSGTFTQTGGTVTASAALIGRRNGVGLYKISGGTLTTTGDLRVPDVGSITDVALQAAQGTLEISGPLATTVTVGANLNIGLGNPNGTTGAVVGAPSTVLGTVNQTGGTILFNAAVPIYAVGNGLGATGTVNQSSGLLDMTGAPNTGTSNLDLGRNNASGTYNLSGDGVVKAKSITMESGLTTGSASRTFNVNGGTLTATLVNFGTAAPTAGATLTRSFNVSGGIVSIGSITTGLNATTYVSGGTFSINTLLTLSSTSTLRTSIPLTLTAPVTLGSATIRVDANTLGLSGAISGVGNLTKTGAGTLLLSGANGSTGNTVVNAGTVQATTTTALAGYNVAGKITANSGGTVAVNVGGATGWAEADVTTLRSNATLNAGSFLGLDSTNSVGTFTYSPNITGAYGISKLGTGTVALSGANTYTGGTTVTNGKLELAAPAATLGTGNVTVSGTASGTFLAIDNGVVNAIANSATLSLAGGGTGGGLANLGVNVNEDVAALSLAGAGQTAGLTYGSTTSSALIKSDVFFAGTGIVTVGTAGDYNNSGTVDAADYVMWRANPAGFGGSGGYDLWRQNFGAVAVPGAGASLGENQAVPEPGTLLLVVAGALLVWASRRRRDLHLVVLMPVRR